MIRRPCSSANLWHSWFLKYGCQHCSLDLSYELEDQLEITIPLHIHTLLQELLWAGWVWCPPQVVNLWIHQHVSQRNTGYFWSLHLLPQGAVVSMKVAIKKFHIYAFWRITKIGEIQVGVLNQNSMLHTTGWYGLSTLMYGYTESRGKLK